MFVLPIDRIQKPSFQLTLSLHARKPRFPSLHPRINSEARLATAERPTASCRSSSSTGTASERREPRSLSHRKKNSTRMNEKQHTSSLTESPTCHSTPPSQSCHHASPHSCHHASSHIRHAPTKRLPQHPYRINPAAGSQPTKLISATGQTRNAPPPHQRERSIASCPLPKRKAHHRELQQYIISQGRSAANRNASVHASVHVPSTLKCFPSQLNYCNASAGH